MSAKGVQQTRIDGKVIVGLQKSYEAEEMDEKWRSSPALRALSPAVLKQLQGYQEEADALYRETQASTSHALWRRGTLLQF